MAVIKTLSFAVLWLAALGLEALAAPPADIDECLKLSGDTAKAAKVDTEAKYVKFHSRMLDLDVACGRRDYVAAERISAEIKAEFPPGK